VVVDTSLRSVSAADAAQQPLESQTVWLKNVLCFAGDGDGCTRSRGQQAVVVSNAPTYSYGPGTSETEIDSTTFESLLFKYRVSAVVSGRLGWNALYWAIAPGVHAPCPGGAYPAGPPQGSAGVCGSQAQTS